MIVNYVRECTAFIAYVSDNKVSANEFVLWHALLNAINQRATSNDWPDEFVPVSNPRLLSLTTFGAGKSAEETLRKTRDRLVARGLIRYMAGEKNKRNPAYKMVLFTGTMVPDEDVTQYKLGNAMGNTQGKAMGNMQGKAMGNAQGILRKPNGNGDKHTTAIQPQGFTRARDAYTREDGSTAPARYDGAYQTSERARRAIAQRLLDGFPGQVDTGDSHAVLCERMRQGLAPELIEDVAAQCATTGELEARLFGACMRLGLGEAQQRQDLSQCRVAAGGDERLAQALYRVRTGYPEEREG